MIIQLLHSFSKIINKLRESIFFHLRQNINWSINNITCILTLEKVQNITRYLLRQLWIYKFKILLHPVKARWYWARMLEPLKMFICRCKSSISLYQAFSHSLMYFLTLIALLFKFPITNFFFKVTLLFFKSQKKNIPKNYKKKKFKISDFHK